MISRDQKDILKDLIIAGDGAVQGAIDAYEAGDPSKLEEMVRSGALLARSSDVDLLGDLDLDFLNVHGNEEEDDGMVFGNMDDIGGPVEPTRVTSGGYNNGNNNLQKNAPPTTAHGGGVPDFEARRARANSLAVPGLVLDGANPNDVPEFAFGNWTDQNVPGPGGGGTTPRPLMQALGTAVPSGREYRSTSIPLADQVPSRGEVPPPSNPAAGQRPGSPKKPRAKKEKKKKAPAGKKEKKEKKEPRERKSQSKMRDMMEGIASSGAVSAVAAGGEGKGEDEGKPPPASGLGRPRSMSDPNLSVRLDDHGLLHVDGPDGWVGAYSPDSRQLRVNRFLEKRNKRVWVKKVKYDVRKNFADSRLRVKGRFVKKEDEMLMRELMSMT